MRVKPTVVAAPDSEIAEIFLRFSRESINRALLARLCDSKRDFIPRSEIITKHHKINRTLGHPKCGYFLAKLAYFK